MPMISVSVSCLPFCVIATTEALQLLPSWVECVREAEELCASLTAEYTETIRSGCFGIFMLLQYVVNPILGVIQTICLCRELMFRSPGIALRGRHLSPENPHQQQSGG